MSDDPVYDPAPPVSAEPAAAALAPEPSTADEARGRTLRRAPQNARKQLVNAALAARWARGQELAPFRAFLDGHGALYAAAAELRSVDFARCVVREQDHRLGLFAVNHAHMAPFFWFGLDWSQSLHSSSPVAAGEPPTLPYVGVALQINGPFIGPFEAGVAGLRRALLSIVESTPAITLRRHEDRYELCWLRELGWLLPKVNQRLALEQMWFRFLDLLSAHGACDRLQAFIYACESAST